MRRLSVTVVAGALLVACSADPAGVLTVDDVPGATSVKERNAMGRVSGCQLITDSELMAATQATKKVLEFPLGDGVAVVTVAAKVSGDEGLETIDDAIQRCVARNGEDGTTTTSLTDLPEGVVGFESTSRATPENEYGTRLWTYKDERLVAVGLVRPESTPAPDIDLVELLETAVERSKGLQEGE